MNQSINNPAPYHVPVDQVVVDELEVEVVDERVQMTSSDQFPLLLAQRLSSQIVADQRVLLKAWKSKI